MDFSNVIKQIEQFIFELLMWVIFYPYTLLRIMFRPIKTLNYVAREIRVDPDIAFGNAIRPPLFLCFCIAIGSVISPLGAEQAAELAQTDVGAWITKSWVNLLALRTLGFAIFALAGALVYDWVTPGAVTRETLKLPFYQQCYICGPFALGFSPALVRFEAAPEAILPLLLALEFWLIAMQTLFFRRLAVAGWVMSFLMGAGVVIFGNAALVIVPTIAENAIN